MLEVFECLHAVRNPLKNIVEQILGGVPEEFSMLAANRSEADCGALQGHRSHDLERRCG
jgi:hypothetical protein